MFMLNGVGEAKTAFPMGKLCLFVYASCNCYVFVFTLTTKNLHANISPPLLIVQAFIM